MTRSAVMMVRALAARFAGAALRCVLIPIALMLGACGSGTAPSHTWQQDAAGSFNAALSADGRLLAATTIEQGTGLWDLSRGERLYKWQHQDGGPDNIAHIAIARDGSHVVTADKRTWVVWDARTGKGLGYWQVDADITAVAISDRGRHVVLGLEDGRAMHIDQRSQRRLEVIAHAGEAVGAVAISADGSRAATAGGDRSAALWDTRGGEELMRHAHDSRVLIVATDRAGEMLFSADNRGGVFLGKLGASRRVRLDLGSRNSNVSSARFSADGRLLLTGFPGGGIRLWNAYTGEPLERFTSEREFTWQPRGNVIQALAFGGDRQSVIAQGSNGDAHRWPVRLAGH